METEATVFGRIDLGSFEPLRSTATRSLQLVGDSMRAINYAVDHLPTPSLEIGTSANGFHEAEDQLRPVGNAAAELRARWAPFADHSASTSQLSGYFLENPIGNLVTPSCWIAENESARVLGGGRARRGLQRRGRRSSKP